MKFTELLDQIEKPMPEGLARNYITLVLPRHGRGERMRVAPGLMGRILGSNADGTIVSVSVADVRRFLLRYLEGIEGLAVEYMERGDMERGEYYLAQYRELNARLSLGSPR